MKENRISIVKYLAKQPKWRAFKLDGLWWTGYQTTTPHPDYWYTTKNPSMCEDFDVPVLNGKLTLVDFGRGRSSVVYYFEDVDGNRYECAPKAAFGMFKKTKKGVFVGDFTLIKQGSSVSITPYEG